MISKGRNTRATPRGLQEGVVVAAPLVRHSATYWLQMRTSDIALVMAEASVGMTINGVTMSFH